MLSGEKKADEVGMASKLSIFDPVIMISLQ